MKNTINSIVENLILHLSRSEKTLLARYRKPNNSNSEFIGKIESSLIEFETSPFGNLDKLKLEHCFTFDDDKNIQDFITKKKKYSLVLGNFPFGMRNTQTKKEVNIEEIDKASYLINDDGVGVFFAPMSFSASEHKLTELLAKNNKFVSGVISLPNKYLMPITSIKVILLLISNKLTDKIFLAELSDFSDAKLIADNYLNIQSTENLNGGKWINKKECLYGLESYKSEQLIAKLSKKSDYDNYKKYQLDDLASNFNLTKEKFNTNKSNTVYVPLIGKRECSTKLNSESMKHQNYCQIIIENDIARPAYLAEYLNTQLGKLQLENATTGLTIRRINITNLKKVTVPIPSLLLQKNIIKYKLKLIALADTINNIKENISSNPITSEDDLQQIDRMMDVIGRLNQTDKIRNLIIKGESKTLEFKETFQIPVKTANHKKVYEEKQEWVETQVFKTIAAFLNSEGGELLVGISDDLEIIVIDFEIDKYQKTNDDFLQYFRNKLKKRIGEISYQFINYDLIKIDNKRILHVIIKPSTKEMLLDDKDFYVRINPASDKLEGQKMLEYIKNRFYA